MNEEKLQENIDKVLFASYLIVYAICKEVREVKYLFKIQMSGFD